MFDITAIGEVLIDFHAEADEILTMRGSLGGATCNVLTQASKLGRKCCLIGAVGNDVLGDYIITRVKQCGVTPHLHKSNATTTMAIVTLDNNGDRSFDFIRNPGADSDIEYSSEIAEIIANSKIVEYGSLAFSAEPAASTIFKVLNEAKCTRAYDPNLRPAIWKNDALMIQMALEGMKYADILKVGDDEIVALTGCASIDEAALSLQNKYGIKSIFVTCGSRGCRYFVDDFSGSVSSYNVVVSDTTGAGDSFFGALLSRYLHLHDGFRCRSNVEEAVKYACAAGALTASKKGTAEAMPCQDEILNLMESC